MQGALREQQRTQKQGASPRRLPTKEETNTALRKASDSSSRPVQREDPDSGAALTWKEALAAARLSSSKSEMATSNPLTDTFG